MGFQNYHWCKPQKFLLPLTFPFLAMLLLKNIFEIRKRPKRNSIEHVVFLRQSKKVPRVNDCTCIAALRNATNSLRAINVLICIWIVLAALLSTSVLFASREAICPALRKIFVLPICPTTVTDKLAWRCSKPPETRKHSEAFKWDLESQTSITINANRIELLGYPTPWRYIGP